MRFCLMVTGPAYGTQRSSTAWLFASELIEQLHVITSIFFYCEGVLNASMLNCPSNDEVHMTRYWQKLSKQHGVILNVCISAALRRGVCGQQEAQNLHLSSYNLASGFRLSGLGELAEAVLNCDRVVQF
ncbi:sulfurtransferase complex subunit TusD [Candidatus Erwinia haradaeae]|uniref:Sulfurtransferase TusD n=1 Tax=Candidatus Erwinia haradaeae TaxID=1922217 RepID=A0A451D7X1_9GAMM|nr:sulfurtransferase complex subunit TusD [Candidatus Erwinia haradaeae]VFP81918.1 Sulfurtransferase TusD [Candidatus Erwinia haradaeae]